MKKGANKPFEKKMFPRLLSQALEKMKENLEGNIVSGFKKGGINPLNRGIVLERLPDYEESGSNLDVSESLTNFLKEMQ
ncbi:hypothetical protein C0J52_18028 [Blattella germanica]|nr:hypothetical protein C0J52_18028 [Blattella germanica]